MRKILLILALLISSVSFASTVIDPNVSKLGSSISPDEMTVTDGQIIVGNSSGIGTGVTPSGDVTITNTGVTAIASGVIVTADISNRTIGAVDINTDSITANELGASSVSASEIEDNSIGQSDIGNGGVGSAEIYESAVIAEKISNFPLGNAVNCGIVDSGSTVTIGDADLSTALSSTNECRIGVQSDSTGGVDVASFTSNVTITDASVSGNLLGITGSSTWANVLPLFISVVDSGTNNDFILSRVVLTQTGTTGQLCNMSGTADCDDQGDAIILSSTSPTVYAGKPVTLVAWIEGTLANSLWVLSTPITSGFNSYFSSKSFTVPTGLNGAITNSHLVLDGGGTGIPTWASATSHTYYVSTSGEVTEYFSTTGSGSCTNGTGADGLNLISAFKPTSTTYQSCGYYKATGSGSPSGSPICVVQSGSFYVPIYTYAAGGLPGDDFSNSGDDINISIKYKQ